MLVRLFTVIMINTANALKDEFNKFSFKLPEIKVISNFKASPFKDIRDIIEGLIKQTYSTVRWFESIKYIKFKYWFFL